MTAWPEVSLAEIFEIARGGSPRPIQDFITDDPNGVNWVMIGDAPEGAKYITGTKKRIKRSGVSRSRMVHPGDFLLTNSMSFGRPYIMKTSGCIHDGWLVLSGRDSAVHPDYFYHLLGSDRVYAEFKRLAAGATVKNLNIELVSAVKVPLPPLDEQRRIAAILDKADAIRRKRQQALALADDFLRSAFLEMFGDPVTNPKHLTLSRLGEVASFISGATPSKERKDYWEGSFPWISPKDMKRERIDTAEDAVSDLVFRETSLKKIPPRTVLIVVRGMILAHTVPVGVSTVPLAINQDMKAIQFDDTLLPEFGLWCLKVQHGNMLSKIDTAAHGTKRFELDRLKSLPILIPPREAQEQFVQLYESFHAHRDCMKTAALEDEALFASLSQRAFRGDLSPTSIAA